VSIILIGYRGSGKTTVGRKLAKRLGKEFVDADDLVVRAAGQSIREIFAQHGEERFRDLEAEAVSQLAGKEFDNHVIALGGGALGRPENRKTLSGKNHRIIHLRCDPAELLNRINADAMTSDNRPPLTNLGGGLEEIQKLLRQREPIYTSIMTAELDVTRLSPDQAVAEIARLLE
jgi:shikimate kinase